MYLYALRNELGRVKIGTTDNLKKEIIGLETCSGVRFVEKYCINSVQTEYFKEELLEYFKGELHEHFKEKRVFGFWFEVSIDEVLDKLSTFGCILEKYYVEEKLNPNELLRHYNKLTKNEKESFITLVKNQKELEGICDSLVFTRVNEYVCYGFGSEK